MIIFDKIYLYIYDNYNYLVALKQRIDAYDEVAKLSDF